MTHEHSYQLKSVSYLDNGVPKVRYFAECEFCEKQLSEQHLKDDVDWKDLGKRIVKNFGIENGE